MMNASQMVREQPTERFYDLTAQLAEQVRGGYLRNEDAINDLMAQGVEDDCFIRHFFRSCLVNPAQRGLCSSQSFALHVCDDYVLRINLWLQSGGFDGFVNKMVDDYFSIDICHNHTFDFFTVGAFGPGYRTEFFETRQDLWSIAIGDRVEPDKEWAFQLDKAKALFVPSGTHFHVQHAPDSFSVSINLIPSKKPDKSPPQIILSEDNRTVRKIVERFM